ncbi:hypothetical protein BDSB_29505 [Burkholderia dolosa PC543]|nr:hypothetical protein BDSB_29505 [Burkholderia dolosa PC543]
MPPRAARRRCDRRPRGDANDHGHARVACETSPDRMRLRAA